MAGPGRSVSIRLAVENAEEAIKKLKAFGDQGEAAIAKLRGMSAQATPALGGVKKGLDEVAASSSGFSKQVSGNVQNVSFQLQDFVVQVSAGTSAAQAFAQQAPQLFGAFGPVGAVLGLVAGVVGGLSVALLDLGEDIDAATRAAEDFERAQALTQRALGDTKGGIEDLAEAYAGLTVEQRALKQVAIDRAAEEQARAIESARDATLDLARATVEQVREAIRASDSYDATGDSVRNLRGLTREYLDQIDAFGSGGSPAAFVEYLKAVRDGAPETADAINPLIDKIVELQETLEKASEATNALRERQAALRGLSADARAGSPFARASSSEDIAAASLEVAAAAREAAETAERERQRLAEQAAREEKRRNDERIREEERVHDEKLRLATDYFNDYQDELDDLAQEEQRQLAQRYQLNERYFDQLQQAFERDRKRRYDAMAEPWMEALRDVQSFATDILGDIGRSGRISLESIGDGLIETLQRTVANIGGSSLTNAIQGGIGSLGGLFNNGFGSFLKDNIAGGATFNPLSLLGVGLPIVGGLIGNLFERPSDRTQITGFDFRTGTTYQDGQTGAKFSAENRQLADQIAAQVAAYGQQLAQKYGEALTTSFEVRAGDRDGLRFKFGGDAFKQFDDAADLIAYAMRRVEANFGTAAERAELLAAAARKAAEAQKEQARETAAAVVKDYKDRLNKNPFKDLLRDYYDLTAKIEEARNAGLTGPALQPLKDIRQKVVDAYREDFLASYGAGPKSGLAGRIAEIEEQFRLAIRSLERIGQSTEGFPEAKAKAIADAVNEFVGAFAVQGSAIDQLKDRVKQIDDAIKQVTDLGKDASKLREARKDTILGFAGDVTSQFRTLTPIEQIREALKTIDDAAKAVTDLGESAAELLKVRKEYINDQVANIVGGYVAQDPVAKFKEDIAALQELIAQGASFPNTNLKKVIGGFVDQIAEPFLKPSASEGLRRTLEQIDAAIAAVRELGGDERKLVDARKQAIQTARESAEAEIQSLRDRERSIGDQMRAFAESLIDPLQDGLRSIRTGSLSTLSAPTQVAELKARFDTLLEGANRGNVSDIQSVAGAAQEYLQSLRAYGASGGRYQDAFRTVNAALQPLLDKQLAREQSLPDIVERTADEQLAEMQANRKETQDKLKEMIAELKKLNQVAGGGSTGGTGVLGGGDTQIAGVMLKQIESQTRAIVELTTVLKRRAA